MASIEEVSALRDAALQLLSIDIRGFTPQPDVFFRYNANVNGELIEQIYPVAGFTLIGSTDANNVFFADASAFSTSRLYRLKPVSVATAPIQATLSCHRATWISDIRFLPFANFPTEFEKRSSLWKTFGSERGFEAQFTIKKTDAPNLPWWEYRDDAGFNRLGPITQVEVVLRVPYADAPSWEATPLPRRRKRIYGRSDRPAWRDVYESARDGKKFARQRKKLTASPNENGFGKSGTKPGTDTLYDKAKKIVVEAAIEGVKTGVKTIAAKQKKTIVRRIRDNIDRVVKESKRKR